MDEMNEMIAASVAMSGPDWFRFVRTVSKQRNANWAAHREVEAERLAATMDMTPEGYVREWNRQGRQNHSPLLAWEWAYQRAGLIEAAERKGYISIGRAVSCPITIESRGLALLAEPVT